MTYSKYHRSYALINLKAISHNLNELKKCLNNGVKTMAVVKADAYGHGSAEVSKHIENDVDYFAVAAVEEAVVLRKNGVVKPILVLSYTGESEYKTLVENDITATLYNFEEAEKLSSLAQSLFKKAKVHIAVDTGMGRIGVTPDIEGADIVKKISLLNGIELEGLFSHFAMADYADKTDTVKQTELFDYFISLLEERKIKIPLKHICNSAGAMETEKQYDMCRIGIALYGLYPSEEIKRDKVKLIPAMEVISRVIHVKKVEKGFKIGYGYIYEAPSQRTIATVCIGYADGYRRCLTGKSYVLIKGKKAKVVGKICMDQIMVDVTDIEDVKVGEKVVIMGKSENEEITAEILGEMGESFNYEVVCNFMPRVTRIYD